MGKVGSELVLVATLYSRPGAMGRVVVGVGVIKFSPRFRNNTPGRNRDVMFHVIQAIFSSAI